MMQKHCKEPQLWSKSIWQTFGLWPFAQNLPKQIKLAYLPNLGRVRLRLSGKGTNEILLKQKINKEIDKLLPLIKDIFVGYEDLSSLEEQIQKKFLEKKWLCH